MRRFGPPAHRHASSIPGAPTVNVQQLSMLRVHHPFILCLGMAHSLTLILLMQRSRPCTLVIRMTSSYVRCHQFSIIIHGPLPLLIFFLNHPHIRPKPPPSPSPASCNDVGHPNSHANSPRNEPGRPGCGACTFLSQDRA